jgi:aldehyde:ferredoxin oxidoreductase
LEGEAKDWTYLYVPDERAELRSADHLVGRDTWEAITGYVEETRIGRRSQ